MSPRTHANAMKVVTKELDKMKQKQPMTPLEMAKALRDWCEAKSDCKGCEFYETNICDYTMINEWEIPCDKCKNCNGTGRES